LESITKKTPAVEEVTIVIDKGSVLTFEGRYIKCYINLNIDLFQRT
jgi:hypothetical protein